MCSGFLLRDLQEAVDHCGRRRDAASHSLGEGGNLRGVGLCNSAEIPSRKKSTLSRTQQNSSTHLWHHHKRVSLTLLHSCSLTLLLSCSQVTLTLTQTPTLTLTLIVTLPLPLPLLLPLPLALALALSLSLSRPLPLSLTHPLTHSCLDDSGMIQITACRDGYESARVEIARTLTGKASGQWPVGTAGSWSLLSKGTP